MIPVQDTPVVVAVLAPDRTYLLVDCPYCQQPERHPLALGPIRARCGGGEYRVVVRPGGGDAA